MQKKLYLGGLLWISVAHASPPAEVPPDAVFGADRQTLSWSVPSGGANTFNVYRGTVPSIQNHECRVIGSTVPSAVLSEIPENPGGLFYFLVSAVNPDGESRLAVDSNGIPIPTGSPCSDADGDSVPDNRDSCPSTPNSTQDDQDQNGVGDRCDPNTYDFEADIIGQRPADVVQFGSNVPFLVKDFAGDRGVSYEYTYKNVTDRLERLLAEMPQQDTTVYLDFADSSETCAAELWSEGSASLDSGTALVLEIGPSRGLTLYRREGNIYTPTNGPVAPLNGRLRLRLIKGPGTTSALHVDSWDGQLFVPDLGVFDIPDDHRYRGLGTTLASRGGRPARRETRDGRSRDPSRPAHTQEGPVLVVGLEGVPAGRR